MLVTNRIHPIVPFVNLLTAISVIGCTFGQERRLPQTIFSSIMSPGYSIMGELDIRTNQEVER